MLQSTHRYPVGIQTFSEIRGKDYLYIDKTEYIYQLTHSHSKYIFLSRPRRFGKSLLTSTLQCYFEGRKELFQDLKIMELEQEWTGYPVLHFDMSTAKHESREGLEHELTLKLESYEALYGRNPEEKGSNQRLKGIIERAYRKTGKQVVVLIDEYDAPMLDVVHEEENLPKLRQVMRNFYSPLKACDSYLRFVFFTGITKFSQLSVFSELNNMTNVSMDEPYAGICGITRHELVTVMKHDVACLAERYGINPDEMLQKLSAYYDGYHFCWPSPDIFNPFSLMTCFSKMKLGAYWFESGTPTYIIELLRRCHALPSHIGGERLTESSFNIPLEQAATYVPLLYQAGYLTINGLNPVTEQYLIDIPNAEVRTGLMRSLLPAYINNGAVADRGQNTVAEMYGFIYDDDMDGALRLLQTFLRTVPQCDHIDYEGHYQQVLYIIFSLFGVYTDIEVRTSTGRVDMVMRSPHRLYIIELKLNRSAEAAFNQIDLKHYPERFALYRLPRMKVGINFSSEERTITDWKIEAAE